MSFIHGLNLPQEVVKITKSLEKDRFKYLSLISVRYTKLWINDATSMSLRKILKDIKIFK